MCLTRWSARPAQSQHVHEYLRDLGLANSASSTMLVALLAILNWAAPSTISIARLALQEALLNSGLNTVGFDCLGLVFLPAWERKKGLMYKVESLLFFVRI